MTIRSGAEPFSHRSEWRRALPAGTRRLPTARRVELVEECVAELVRRGTTVEHRRRSDDPDDLDYHVVLHDPGGNEFCVG